MSLRKVNAGRGYEYLLRSVATNDAVDNQAPSLEKYYAAKGTPPGRWLGKGIAGFESENIDKGAEINELQMAALYGEGIHPETDEYLHKGKKLSECDLGRPFPIYAENDELLIKLRDWEKKFKEDNDRLPSREERAKVALEIGTKYFINERKTTPINGKEVIDFINDRKDKLKQATAGYDFTFSPVKSVSVLWAISDEQIASRIAECHHRAVAKVIEWAEEEIIRCRSGAGGIKQVKTRGLIAAEFTHFDTRAGDPDLHSHVLVSNKVQDENGEWKALDGRTIFRHHQAMSFRYNALLQDELSRELGLEFEAHERGEAKAPVWEIKGIPQEAIEEFSKRKQTARPVVDQKIADYRQRYGKQPSARVINQLWQDAILETRDAKKPAESLSTLRENWVSELTNSENGEKIIAQIRAVADEPNAIFAELKTLTNGNDIVEKICAVTHEPSTVLTELKTLTSLKDVNKIAEEDHAFSKEALVVALALHEHSNGQQLLETIHRTKSDERPFFNADDHTQLVATKALETVTNRRSRFRRSHLHTAVSTVLAGYRFADLDEFSRVEQSVVDTVVENYGISLNGTELLDLPSVLVDEQGHGIDRVVDHELFTTAEIWAEEQKIHDAAQETTAYLVTRKTVDSALKKHEKTHGWALNDGQAQLAHHFLGAGTLLATGVGPAGTGKTASMKLVTDTWKKEGHNVIALAPSASAAKVLENDLDAQAHTIDSLVFTWLGNNPNREGFNPAELPVEINPGDMLLVDEAGMASTKHLSALVDIAHATGAVLRLVGDHKQIDAVERGGVFGALVQSSPTVELNQVMRFGDDQEQAAAANSIRSGHISAIELYEKRGWLHKAHEKGRDDILNDAVGAYLNDISLGRSSLVLATTNRDVEIMNDMVRAQRIASGEVDTSREVELSSGQVAGIGDTVLARKNQKFTTSKDKVYGSVINGNLFSIVRIGADGTLKVKDLNSKKVMTLPADYVAKHMQLGYAATVHRAQGATVDICRSVIDTTADRSNLYVAMTRGKLANHVYPVVDVNFDYDAEQGHMHYQGEGKAATEFGVLAYVIEKDARQRSAMETLWEETQTATSHQRLKSLWNYGRETIIDSIIETEFDEYRHYFTTKQRQAIEATKHGYEPVTFAWRKLMRAGIDPREMMAEATTALQGAEDYAKVVAARLYEYAEINQDDNEAQLNLPPETSSADKELYAWLRRTKDELDAAASSNAPDADAANEETNDTVQHQIESEKAITTAQHTQRQTTADGLLSRLGMSTRKNTRTKQGSEVINRTTSTDTPQHTKTQQHDQRYQP